MIDPETAPTVKWIYELYAQGKTIAEIVNLLNSQGLRTLRGRPFTHNSLRTLLKNEKYIGVYTYKDEVRIEGAIPPIIEPDTFEKVQRMLKYNQKAAAHKNAKTEYLLTEKLFCGKCGAMMVGVSGTGKSGVRHHYYYCSGQRRKICGKKPVRKEWIEQLVLKRIAELLQNDEILDFIAESTYQYYVRQNTDSSYTESLCAELRDTEHAMTNLVRALEAGIFNDATRTRMEELDEQKRALSASLAAAKLKQDLGLKKEHIVYFLHRFSAMDCHDRNCQKQLIRAFLNSVFVYDDKVVLTFNYSGDDRTITLREIDAGLQQGVCLPRASFHHAKTPSHLGWRFCMAALRGARNPRVRPTGFRGVSTPQFCALRKIKKKIQAARRRRSRRSIPLGSILPQKGSPPRGAVSEAD